MASELLKLVEGQKGKQIEVFFSTGALSQIGTVNEVHNDCFIITRKVGAKVRKYICNLRDISYIRPRDYALGRPKGYIMKAKE